MKKNALLLIMALASLNLFSQIDPAMVERLAPKMKEELSLTDEQFARLKKINEKFRSAHASLRADTTLTRDKALVERRQIQDDRNNAIKEMLTKEQFAKWNEVKSGPRQKKTASNPMEEMKTALGLTDDQVKKIEAINLISGGEFKKLRADTTVSVANKRKTIVTIQEARKEKIKKILTEEQYLNFLLYEADKAKNRRREGGPVRR
ncbi:MAG: hypothetical protein WD824_06870 [Cyclobacteriaceae bacterium]